MSLTILIIDLEVNPDSNEIFKIGAYRPDTEKSFESKYIKNKAQLEKAFDEIEKLTAGASHVMGHHIIEHDLPCLHKAAPDLSCLRLPVIDTLRLSPLAFPQNPYHRLLKNHKIIASQLNSPEADCRATWTLFQDQCRAFNHLRVNAPQEFELYENLYGVLPYLDSEGQPYIAKSIHSRMDMQTLPKAIVALLQDNESDDKTALKVCWTRLAPLRKSDASQHNSGVVLAYTVSWLKVSGGNSVLAPWVRHTFPDVPRLIHELRDIDCGSKACHYCQQVLNPKAQLKRYFGWDDFRDVKGIAGGQEVIVQAGMNGESLLAILPTGGGKSLCFQLPALNRYYRNGGLTIVVCPLQSLMLDQVNSLKKHGISGVDTLNGMLSITERADILDKIALGDIGILFIAPEQFRNNSFIKAISQRQINGWVFDEAHCLSKWGHDFRPDYLYVSAFIKQRHQQSPDEPIAPISCFTATAKPDVLQEIRDHFQQQLGLSLREFIGGHERSNLDYEVIEITPERKNQKIHELLHDAFVHEDGGAVVFTASRKATEMIADFLKQQQWQCEHFHAGLQSNEKADVQQRFIEGDLKVIVATNAFGMGVDKPDVRLVIHADIPGSLENYLQEAGRAGRDREQARCVLLYDVRDIDAQFRLSRFSQLELRDLKAIWKRLKMIEACHQGSDMVVTGGEILSDNSTSMSFDSDDDMADTKVKTALAWLERASMLKRHENQTRIFPARSGAMTLEKAQQKLQASALNLRKKQLYQTVIEIVFSTPDDEILSTDTLSKATASSFTELRGMLFELEELGILENDTRMTVNLRTDTTNPAKKRLIKVLAWEEALWEILHTEIPDADQQVWQSVSLSSVCQAIRHATGCDEKALTPPDIKLMLFALADDKSAEKTHSSGSLVVKDKGNDTLAIRFKNAEDSWEDVLNRGELRRLICTVIVPFLIAKTGGVERKDAIAETSYGELKKLLGNDMVIKAQVPDNNIEVLLKQALLYLHKMEVIKLNHGMTILRHAMTIELDKLALEKKRQYLKNDYKPLSKFYGEKQFQIHVMREYAIKMLEHLSKGKELVNDYFQKSNAIFKNKWFNDQKEQLKESISPESSQRIYGDLDERQRAIVMEKDDSNRLVLAGPGSGKTRVIVHRVAYLLCVEHIDAASVIVLTFNRHAATDIKQRLYDLVGNLAFGVTVSTYDSMAMRLLGVRFDNEKYEFSDTQLKVWCEKACELLKGELAHDNDEDDFRDKLLAGFRYILVDEYQDINETHYNLVSALAGRQLDSDNKLTLLAVGDDDQNIYEFRDSNNEYIHRFCSDYTVESPDFLTYNYRSTQAIIEAANAVIAPLSNRLKVNNPIVINPERENNPHGGVWAKIDSERQGKVRVIRLYKQNTEKSRANVQAQAAIEEIRRLQEQTTQWQWEEFAVLSHNNTTLQPLQTWCEARKIPYHLAKDSKVRLTRLRQFVYLTDSLQTHKDGLTTTDFTQLLASQPVDNAWQHYFSKLINEFVHEHGEGIETDSEQTTTAVRYSPAYLRKWLYDAVGNSKHISGNDLYLGTVHSAKGLEFKHVFLLSDQWQNTSAPEQRLFYVAMTRAIDTLTIINDDLKHAWVKYLPTSVEYVSREYPVSLPMNKQYYRFRLSELYMDLLAHSYAKNHDKVALEAVKNLNVGDKLIVTATNNGKLRFMTENEITVALTATITEGNVKKSEQRHLPVLTQGTTAFVADLYVRYLTDIDETRLDSYSEKLTKWTLVIPQLVIPDE